MLRWGSAVTVASAALAGFVGAFVGTLMVRLAEKSAAWVGRRWRYRKFSREFRKVLSENPGPVWIPYVPDDLS